MKKFLLMILSLCSLMVSNNLVAQKKKTVAPLANNSLSEDAIIKAQNFRLIGPFRGGRAASGVGSYTDVNTFYMGATGGGVWKTTDAGSNWKNISDGFFGGTIGAIAIAPTNESIVYVGEGENSMRGNVSEGLGGMWKSTDDGKTWKNMGLKEARHIVRIVVHPKNPDIIWAAVMGHLFGPNETRGVFKSTDGGQSWKKVLYVNEQTGASELVIDPSNPEILYAGTWQLIRTPYSLESGGEGSGLYKSTDGGDTWTSIKTNKGFPKGVWGITGIAVAKSNSDKLYALIENKDGGLYVSENAGKTWELVNSDNNIRQRAWYYTKVFVDPVDENKIYCPNVNFMMSSDGGKSFVAGRTPHGDHHDLWIDPKNGKRMIVADDGGAQVSLDGAKNWSTVMNQPTVQVYRLSTDNHFPYRILGAQQDNSAFRILSSSYGAYIGESDFEVTAGGESGYIVADPLNNEVVYGGSYGGLISRFDHKTGENRVVNVWPDNPMGAGADVQKYRFQWNHPIFFSPHNPKKLYTAGNHLFSSENDGASWTELSPDLTTNDKSRQKSSGGPITQDNTSVEYYCTIFTAAESPLEKDLLWTGSDDGLINVSKDGGAHWKNVTPKDIPQWMMWNRVEIDPIRKGTAYFAGTRYKLDDFAPYLYLTHDYGETWEKITTGINPLHFTRAIVASPRKAGVLFAGTEYGLYVSMNDGKSWEQLQLNLPVTPVTDLLIRDNNLIVGTQGRSIYVLDDLSFIENYQATNVNASKVFPVANAYRVPSQMGGRRGRGAKASIPANVGVNPPKGAVINYWLKDANDSTTVQIDILDENNKLVRHFSSKETGKDKSGIVVENGLQQFTWNLYHKEIEKPSEDLILWNGSTSPVLAAPGKYFAKVSIDKDSVTYPFELMADPNYKVSTADLKAQEQFLLEVSGSFNTIMKALKGIKDIRAQVQVLQKKTKDTSFQKQSELVLASLKTIEEALHQTKAKSGQDVLNFPIRLDDKLAGVFESAAAGYVAPTKQVREAYTILKAQADEQLKKYEAIKKEGVKALNEAVHKLMIPIIGN
ncbi:MAG: glycosyl hydrolase [Sediminibacterium sp.]|nr:MAG: glycosyl hydrolase [Sediminibacterium sp.]